MHINENSLNLLSNLPVNRDKLLIVILNTTACKTKEITELKLSDVSKNNIKIKNRVVPIPTSIYSEIIQYAKKSKLNLGSYLFSSRQNDKITTKRVRQIIQKYTKDILGFKVNPKDIRKASISEKIKKENPVIVKEQVGLKRFDKRTYLSENQINKIVSLIDDKRTKLLFNLLLNGVKSGKITKIKVNEIKKLNLPSNLVKDISYYIKANNLREIDSLFLTRQKSSLTKERIFQIISSLKEKSGIEVSPRILNNTALAFAVSNNDKEKLNIMGLKNRSFHLHGGFTQNE